MDENDPVLSQQTQVVSRLVDHYSRVTVITGRLGKYKKHSNLTVIDSNWVVGKRFLSATRFLFKAIPVLIRNRPQLIFSHMTEVQSLLISLVTFTLRIKHFLWYAHSKKSFFLRWNHVLLDGIITSTSGSCPIISNKIYTIGQAVDSKQFPLRDLNNLKLEKLLHIGRFDRSKNVSMIINEVEISHKIFSELKLTLIGSPSNPTEKVYADLIETNYNTSVNNGWLIFKNSILRSDAPKILKENDVFIHAYQGSLDKTLVEATLVGLPVVTINIEYLKEFGNWDLSNSFHVTLSEQIQYLKSLPTKDLEKELNVRREIAVEKHSLDKWIERLVKVLN